jgi:ATP-dependent Clp protease ATP-binding subunit ClpA
MLSKNLESTLHRALAIAKVHRHEFATLEHLLLALTDDPDASAVLRGCGIDLGELKRKLDYFLEHDLSPLVIEGLKEAKPTAGFQRAVHRAAIHVQSAGKNEVTGANVLVALFSEKDSHAIYFLAEQNIARLDVVNYISHGIVRYGDFMRIGSLSEAAKSATSGGAHEGGDTAGTQTHGTHTGGGAAEEATDPLSLYCTNLNRKASDGKTDILVGREKEIERTVQILCRRTKNNPLYVGEAGVGKTAIAEGLALRIVRGEVPEVLKSMVIFSLDMGSLMAGTRYRGDFEERMKNVIQEIEKLPKAVLFIDEIHTIIGAGSTSGGALDACNLLKPALARGRFRCMGSTTFREYTQHIDKDRALARRFQKVDVNEPDIATSIKILRGLQPYYEEHHKVRYTPAAVKMAVELSARYIHDRHLPDKAIDVLDEAGAAQMLLPANKRRKVISSKDIEAIVAKVARMPSCNITMSDAELLRTLETTLKASVYGQDNAITQLASAIKVSRAGLREVEKPIGNYLFTGPTGVGKTEVANQLAKAMGMELLRFDMSEYMEKHSVASLIGAPPGYVGHDEGGLLTDAVSKTPYAVVLMDEVEKAHPDIFNILLQVMDYGKLTDQHGRTVDFRNTIVIMTSNAGAADMERAPIGFGREARVGEDKDAVNRLFTPEFRNRLDAIIPFHHLEKDTIGHVVDKFMQKLQAQLTDKHIALHMDDQAKAWLIERGYDRKHGARPMARLIAENIKKPLADEILFGALAKGGTVHITVKGEELYLKTVASGDKSSAATRQREKELVL